MNSKRLLVTATLIAGLLSGCANQGGIYAPPGSADRTPQPQTAPEPPPSTTTQQDSSSRSSAPTTGQNQSSPGQASQQYQQSGEAPSGAAVALMNEAQKLMLDGDVSAAISKLERAQRVSPRSAEVYYHLSQAYAQRSELAKAEQFALRGLSYAGNNVRLQKAGWILLANVRRESGNYAGAEQAELKAARL